MSNPESEKNSKGKHPQQVVVQDISVRQGGGTELQSATAVRTTDKILAACAGGCLTSLTMTPLDVVKTRLQTQSQPFSSGTDQYQRLHRLSQNLERYTAECVFEPKGQPTNHPLTHPSLCLNGPCTSSTASTTTLNHLLHEHQLSQVYPSRQSPSSNGTLATCFKSFDWRASARFAQAIYMLGYDTLRSTFLELVPLSDRNGSSSASSPAQLIPLASGYCRARSSPYFSRHLSSYGRGYSQRRPSSLSLYAGLPATLWRDVPLVEYIGPPMRPSDEYSAEDLASERLIIELRVHQLALQSFCAGSLSGALAATLTNPFDVVKTRRGFPSHPT
ncbi:hypothetical protein KEM48_002971 [Puccinia striiformis f. sp. tritici PST-130]|nr:hypothetical protein KEM48_002971 [Puccinia striiformis f. sp. tritici PST-130]